MNESLKLIRKLMAEGRISEAEGAALLPQMAGGSGDFEWQNASINKGANLTLGNNGIDDNAGNPTYPYAKNDVTLLVNAAQLTSDTLPALTYATGDIPKRTLVASTTHKVDIPLPQEFIRTFAGAAGVGANPLAPHGLLIKSLGLFYRVNTADLTSFATMVISSAPLAAGAALPTATVMTSTLAGNTLTQAANTYAAVSTVTTPAFINVADSLIWAVATLVTPATCTVDLLGASWRVAYAMY